MDNIKIVSINVNGLNIATKRRAIFSLLHESAASICLLQETHGTDESTSRWRREWGGPAFFSNGTQSSRGVAILVSRKLYFSNLQISNDEEGRFICVDLDMEGTNFTVGSFYAPTQDKPGAQIQALENLEQVLRKSNANNTVLAGDFNCFLDPLMDRNTHTSSTTHW